MYYNLGVKKYVKKQNKMQSKVSLSKSAKVAYLAFLSFEVLQITKHSHFFSQKYLL